MRDLYVLFACDQWKSSDSMRMIGVFNRSGLLRKVVEKVNNKEFDLADATLPIKQKDIKDYFIDSLDNELTYAYIEQVTINVEV